MTKAQLKITAESAAAYLALPYMRSLVPQEDGTFLAEILEFPGCIATGDTPAEAYQELEAVAESWIEASLRANQPIPPAMDQNDFSGKMVVRMPKSLHRKAAFAAQREGVSLNQYLVGCIAEGVGSAASRSSLSSGTTTITVNALSLTSLPVFQMIGKQQSHTHDWRLVQHG